MLRCGSGPTTLATTKSAMDKVQKAEKHMWVVTYLWLSMGRISNVCITSTNDLLIVVNNPNNSN
jgi:hypothetical protein